MESTESTNRWLESAPSLSTSGNLVSVRAASAPAYAGLLDQVTGREHGKHEVWLHPAATGTRMDESRSPAQSLAGLIHDARNMVSAMELYCELLGEPGVLSSPFRHYAGELRLVSGAGRRLLEKLAVAESMTGLQLDAPPENGSFREVSSYPASHPVPRLPSSPSTSASMGPALLSPQKVPFSPSADPLQGLRRAGRRKVFLDGHPIVNLAEELRANQNLLSALVGPAVTVGLSISGGRRPIPLTGDDFTRVLVNLARNAADAMPRGGHLQIALEEGADYLDLSFTDNGPGIPETSLEIIFSPGFSTRLGRSGSPDPAPALEPEEVSGAWPVKHRGLGLSIVRSIVTAAGGSIWAANRAAAGDPTASKLHTREASQDDRPVCEDASRVRGAVIVMEFPLLESPVVT